MKTAVSLPDSVFREAEELAALLGMSRSGLYAAAIAEYLAARRDSRVTAALDSVYSEERSELDEAWLDSQAVTVTDEGW